MKNDIQQFLNFQSKTKNVKMKYILQNLFKKGGLDCIYDYIEVVEEIILGQIDSENELFYRLKIIEINFGMMQKEKDRLQETLKAFTQADYYETIKKNLKG